MQKAIFAGTFDPPHRGHLDLIQRGASLVGELVVAVAVNNTKRGIWTPAERVALLERCVAGMPGVRVIPFAGLVVELLRQERARVLLRGVRGALDFEAERDLAEANRRLHDPPCETVLLLADPGLAYISSSRIREIASFGGEVRAFLPPAIADEVATRLMSRGAAPT